MESLPIFEPCLVRAHLGRPAALPTATGWGEELLDRAAVHQYRTGLLQVATQDVTIQMSALASQPVPNRDRGRLANMNRCSMDGNRHIDCEPSPSPDTRSDPGRAVALTET